MQSQRFRGRASVLLVESHWPALLYRHPGTLTRALQATPPGDRCDERARLSVDRTPAGAPARRNGAAATAHRGGIGISHALTSRPVGPRGQPGRDGRTAPSRIVCVRTRLQPPARRTPAADPAVLSPQTAGIASLALTQSAILAELSGESDEAIGTLREAFRWVPASLFTFSESEIAARLAVSYSRLGLLRQATDWIEHLTAGRNRRSAACRPARFTASRG